MIEIIDFSNAKNARGIFYGGDAGAKEAIEYENAIWMVKYPKTTRDLVNPQISYTTSPLSEYIGSMIFKMLGSPVHEVVLGTRKNKIVAACKDFTWVWINNESQHKPYELIHFHYLKNAFMSSDIENYSGTGSETSLDEVLATINGEETLTSLKGVKERFWDMFVIDAFIGNNDRNNGNWGVVLDQRTGEFSLAPVYDNGNAFFNKRSIAQIEKRLTNIEAMDEDAYKTPRCAYKYKGLDNESHSINPFDFLGNTKIPECLAALERFVSKICMDDVNKMINAIPEHYEVLSVMPNVQKTFYIKLMEIRLEKFMEIAG